MDDDFSPDQGVLDALAAFGAPQDVIEQATRQAKSGEYEVYPENIQTLNVFLTLSSCWDWLAPAMAMPVRVGIRATEIESTLRLLGIKGKRKVRTFEDIRAMESAALDAFHN